MSRSVAVVLTVTLFALVAGSTATGRSTGMREAGAALPASATSPAEIDRVGPRTSAPRIDPQEDAVDLFGNEVSSAVAGYTYDRSGDLLYEEHSPHTEVPRLTPPTS